jgi:glutaminyl-tRNA synthetase
VSAKPNPPEPPAATGPGRHFIADIVDADLARAQAAGQALGIVTRFPPEPNGYPHIGHAKSITLNFGLAAQYGGRCNLRFDDTNPETEDMEYVEAIRRDVAWLGFQWDGLYYASDYYERLYQWAVQLVRQGDAYVDDSSDEEIKRLRGTVEVPGTPSPGRSRSVEENLDLLARMRAGEFPDGAMVLRAKADLAAANMKMRDPLIYRIRHAHHYRTGDAWCIYPMYDYAHCLSDYIEGITHSLCTLEFENNRELYDWFLAKLVPAPRPRQIEFARLNLNYTVVSKRKLLALVEGGHVDGWDDPRMPTLAGLRRRGVTPEAIRDFCERIGVAKANSTVDMALLENSIREDLNTRAPRVLAVLRPLEVVLENWGQDEVEWLEAPYWPHDVPKEGSRQLPFGRRLWIERDDFAEVPPKGFHRLAPGREVRLRYGYVIRCEGVEKDAAGEVVRLRCTVDRATRGGATPDGRKVQGTIHWVSAAHAVPLEARLYDRLFADERPDNPPEGKDFLDLLNPASKTVVVGWGEPGLATAGVGERFQLERLGYFVVDPDSTAERRVLNRTVTLRDTWAKVAGRGEAAAPPAAAPVAPAAAEATRGARASSAEAPREKPEAAAVERVLDAAQAALAGDLVAAGLARADAEALATDAELAELFAAARAHGAPPVALANWVLNDLRRERKGRPLSALAITPPALAALVTMADDGTLTPTTARELFARLVAVGGDPRAMVAAEGLEAIRDEATLLAAIDQVVAAHPGQLAAFRAGKEALFGFFVGQVMKATGGRAEPTLLQTLLRRRL